MLRGDKRDVPLADRGKARASDGSGCGGAVKLQRLGSKLADSLRAGATLHRESFGRILHEKLSALHPSKATELSCAVV